MTIRMSEWEVLIAIIVWGTKEIGTYIKNTEKVYIKYENAKINMNSSGKVHIKY